MLRQRCGVLEVKSKALEDRYEAEVQLSSSTQARLEGIIEHLKDAQHSLQVALEKSEAQASRVEGLERDIASLQKRLVLCQEMNHHMKEQNVVLERHRVEASTIRSKLGTTAADLEQLRKLCVEGLGLLPPTAEDRPLSGYVSLLEQHFEQQSSERQVLVDVQSCLESIVTELTAARQATRHLSNAAAEEENRGNLSLVPSFAFDGSSPPSPDQQQQPVPPPPGVAMDGSMTTAPALPPPAPSVAPSSRSVSPSLPPTLRGPADLLPWLDRLRALSRSIAAHHWSLVENVRAQKVKLVQLADNNKNLSEEIDQLSNKMKQAASRLIRTENTEQLLTFMEPSRDVAVRSLFRLRDLISEMKVRLTMLHGTVAQTKPHWLELYRHLTMETDPLRASVQQAQGLLAYAFDRCLTMREKEELLDHQPPPSAASVTAVGRDDNGSTLVGPSASTSATTTPPLQQLNASGVGTAGPLAPPFDGLNTVLPGEDPFSLEPQPRNSTSISTPQRTSTSAVIGLGESAVHRELVSRGIQEARRREQMRLDSERQ